MSQIIITRGPVFINADSKPGAAEAEGLIRNCLTV